MQTFEQFQTTKQYSDDIGADLGIPEADHVTGYIYTMQFADGDTARCYLEDSGFQCGDYYAIVYNADCCSDDLAEVERFLFENYG